MPSNLALKSGKLLGSQNRLEMSDSNTLSNENLFSKTISIRSEISFSTKFAAD